MKQNAKIMQKFGIDDIPNLDVCVLGALENLQGYEFPKLPDPDTGERPRRTLIIGSGNAEVTGRIIFRGINSIFADESTDFDKLGLEFEQARKEAYIISASGGKSVPKIVDRLRKENRTFEERIWKFGLEKITLLTCNSDAKYDGIETVCFPKQREPYTYNTSTYMGMILAKTKEKPSDIYFYIQNNIAHKIPTNLKDYDSFYFIIPNEFKDMKDMFLTKFDELFGSKISARVFTMGQTEHAKTIVPNDKELFVSLGVYNNKFGENRLNLLMPLGKRRTSGEPAYATMMAMGYYFIGKIQAQNKSFFQENIKRYCKPASKTFGHKIGPIVD